MAGGNDAAAILCPALRFFSSGKDISTHRNFAIFKIFSTFVYAMAGGKDAAAMLCPALRFFSSGKDISTHRDFTILTIFSLFGYAMSGGNDAAAMLCPTLRFFSSGRDISNPFSAGNSSAIVRLQLSSNTAPPLPAVTLPKSRTCFTS